MSTNYHNVSSVDRAIDSRGAATLVNTLIDISDKISFWQRAVQGKHQYMSSEEVEGAERCRNWYEAESKTRTYSCPNFKISAQRTETLDGFKSDLNYHFKNMAELMARTLVSAIFADQGIDAKVYVTSDADDVFSGIDIIVELLGDGGGKKSEYFGIC